MILDRVKMIDISNNNIDVLPDNIILPNVIEFYCSNNKIKKLNNMKMENLKILDISNNKIETIPNLVFPNLKVFFCFNNNLTNFPLTILEWRSLRNIYYENNPIDLSPQIIRFLQRLKNINYDYLTVYSDNQNVHNSNIQLSVKESIFNLTSQKNIDKFNSDLLIDIIINHKFLTNKELLLEYVQDKTEHSTLYITFEEILWYVIKTIDNFELSIQQQIYDIINQEIKESECKCFTGRINRLINSLNGFTPMIKININDSEQISNIIFITKQKLLINNNYTINNHKKMVYDELKDRNYNDDIISEWLEYID
jgi:hypothetical protein